jgi:class 3 adenylate cyclase
MMNYTAIGDSVNLARRLEEAARPGEILVSESVYRQTTACSITTARPRWR